MKKLLFGLLLIILIISNVKAQCPLNIGESPIVSNTGLKLYFPFNGNVNNQGIGNNTAILSGATYTNGICGQALHFDGFNNYVEITPFIQMSGDFTISMWVYLDTLTFEQELFTTREQCQSTYRRYSQAELAINYNAPPNPQPKNVLYMVNTNQNCTGYATGDRYKPTNIQYNNGEWFFIAITLKNNELENRVVNFYYNCEHLSTSFFQDASTSNLFSSSYIMKTYIGGGPNIGSYHYSLAGLIDEFRLYNRILTEDEIQLLYHKCKPLAITISRYTDCSTDSAVITLSNTEKNITYQLFDSTNQAFISVPQLGGCNALTFNTGIINSTTDIYIKAFNPNTGCTTVLDTLLEMGNTNFNYTIHDTIELCDGDSVQINGNYYSSGIIIDSLLSINGCDSLIITNIINVNIPELNIADTTICNGLSYTITLSATNTYLWSDSSTMPSITINKPGIYSVSITDSCKSYTRSFTINYQNCNCLMVVPNVFTPNDDGLNDYFYPIINCNFKEYHFLIFNRWGKLIFETNDTSKKWDGKYYGQNVPDGVYFYLIEYVTNIENKRNKRRGSVTLYR